MRRTTGYPGGVTLHRDHDASERLMAITGARQPSGNWPTRPAYSFAGPTGNIFVSPSRYYHP